RLAHRCLAGGSGELGNRCRRFRVTAPTGMCPNYAASETPLLRQRGCRGMGSPYFKKATGLSGELEDGARNIFNSAEASRAERVSQGHLRAVSPVQPFSLAGTLSTLCKNGSSDVF